MANKEMTEFSVFIQYFSSSDREMTLNHGECYPSSPDALKVNFTLNGIKNMEVLKHD